MILYLYLNKFISCSKCDFYNINYLYIIKMNMQQNMMNMMNMMNNFNAVQVFDPSKIDQRMKKTLMNQTISYSKIGPYKMVPKFKPLTFQFINNFNPGVPSNICEVKIVYEHVLDVLEHYSEKGINYTSNNNMNPVVLNIVGRDFTGSNLESNEEIRDEIINLRTTFNSSLSTSPPFPLKEDECVYMKSITVIRPKHVYGFYGFPQSYRTALITVSPLKTEKLLPENRMSSIDFIKTCTIIESIFQVAICKNHPVLILSPFGHEEDNNPVDDIIKIYNYCIFKYGHFFKNIIIGIPPHYPKVVFQNYEKNIAKPQELVVEVDKQFEKDELKKSLLSKVNKPNQFMTAVDKPIEQNESPISPQKNNTQPNFSQEQMELFMKMMQTMNNK